MGLRVSMNYQGWVGLKNLAALSVELGTEQ
jgi:hypothetical protein